MWLAAVSGLAVTGCDDASSLLVRLAEVPFPSEPFFDREGRYQLRAGYLDCTATADYLYALFPGENSAADLRQDDLLDIRGAAAKFLHQFDWEGKLRAVYELDRDVGDVTVNSTGNVLYGAWFADSGIYRYELPARRNGGR